MGRIRQIRQKMLGSRTSNTVEVLDNGGMFRTRQVVVDTEWDLVGSASEGSCIVCSGFYIRIKADRPLFETNGIFSLPISD